MRISTLKIVATACLALGLSAKSMAQEVQFSQFYASSLYLNPALAGMEQDFTFNSNVRSQWATTSSNGVTAQMSAIVPILVGDVRKVQIGGAGVSIFSDVAGAGSIRTTGFRGTFAYSKSLAGDMHKFSIGLQGGLTQMALDLNSRWPSQYNNAIGGYDPTTIVNTPGFSSTKYFPVVNLGGMWSFNPARNYYRSGTSAFSGIAISNINQPNHSFVDGGTAKTPIVFKYHGGLELHVTRKFNFGPQLLIANQQNFGSQINAGMYMNFLLNESPFGIFGTTNLVLGGWYRVNDAFIASIGVSNASYTLGFSYDATTSSLNTFNNGVGAYELSFSIRNAKDRRRRRFDTPRI
jgi:type IX secretion system PorP/SprF family membrane protein